MRYEMDSFYDFEQVYGDVEYFNDRDRAASRVEFKNGALFQGGSPLDTTRYYNGVFIFVVGEDGELYVHPKGSDSNIYHSSFFGGGKVLAAGYIRVREGVIEWISNKSGHYKPGADVFEFLMKYFSQRGVSLEGKVRVYIPEGAYAGVR